MLAIDLNCDLGEGGGSKELRLLPFLSSVNLGCGAHAGDPDSIRDVAEAAVQAGLRIGAHPAYPDRPNFGRVSMTLSVNELIATLGEQLAFLNELVQSVGGKLEYVKPHGALYHDAIANEAVGRALIQVIQAADSQLSLMGLANSSLVQLAAKEGIPFIAEAFADRRYQNDGSLCPRSEPNAVIDNADEAVEQVRTLVNDKQVACLGGGYVSMEADSFCLHGDHWAAFEFAQGLFNAFDVSTAPGGEL